MFPFDVLRVCENQAILVELKNGETVQGIMANSDHFMNVRLKGAIRTSKDGLQFWKMDDIYIVGSVIQAVRLPDSVLEAAQKIQKENLAAFLKNRKENTSARANFVPTVRGH